MGEGVCHDDVNHVGRGPALVESGVPVGVGGSAVG